MLKLQWKQRRSLLYLVLLAIPLIFYIQTIVGTDQKTPLFLVPNFPCGYPDPPTIEDLRCWTEDNNTYCVIKEVDPLTEVVNRVGGHPRNLIA